MTERQHSDFIEMLMSIEEHQCKAHDTPLNETFRSLIKYLPCGGLEQQNEVAVGSQTMEPVGLKVLLLLLRMNQTIKDL